MIYLTVETKKKKRVVITYTVMIRVLQRVFYFDDLPLGYYDRFITLTCKTDKVFIKVGF